jgi:hypothetical protein
MCINMSQYAEYVISPALIRWWEDKAKGYGPIMAGMLFGAGWWFWVDAVACNSHKIPFDQVGHATCVRGATRHHND